VKADDLAARAQALIEKGVAALKFQELGSPDIIGIPNRAEAAFH
jgi:hypothetical protein